MKLVPLTKGLFAKVSDRIYAEVIKYKWCVSKHGNGYYAERRVTIDGKSKIQYMHQFIMGDNPLKLHIDHIDSDMLNNQDENLRFATQNQNMMNQTKQKNTTSKHKGVYWNFRDKRWQAAVRINGKTKYLGGFKVEDDAGIAYNNAAKIHYGEFAKLNIIN